MRRSALLLVAALLAAAPARPARAEATPGQRAYMEALRAYELADYAAAAARLRVALREDPSEGLRKFRLESLHDEDYLPHLYLGLSLEKLGQPREALDALRESDRQGAVRGRPGSQRILASAMARLAPAVATPVPVAPTAVPPEPAAALSAEPPRPAATEPPPDAPRAQPSPAAPRGAPHAAGAPPPPTVVTAPPAADGGEALRDGIRAFFRGEYGAAERRLEGLASGVPTARAFLALSLAGRYVLGGSRDTALLERARSEMRAARAAGVALPQGNLLPPTLLTLLE